MTFATRTALGILALVVGSTVLAALITTTLLVLPITEDLKMAYEHLMVHLAGDVERGVPVEDLDAELPLAEVTLRAEPPPADWTRREVLGRVVARSSRFPPRLAAPVDGGFLWGQRMPGMLPLGPLVAALSALVVLLTLLSWMMARAALRPVRWSIASMARIAQGDLHHRLDDGGAAELREVARAFNHMADRVTQLLGQHKRQLAGISHELRTPLTRIRLQTELLRREGADAHRLESIERNIGRLDDLIEEALQLSRLDLGQQPVEREPVGLDELAREVAEEVGLGDRALALLGTEGAVIRADRRLLRRALRNLLQNAARHTPPGTTVTLRAVPRGLEIEDDGPGVQVEPDTLFEPFVRSAGAGPEGMGLGLMIVAQIADLHGGGVRAWNTGSGLGLRLLLEPPD